MTPVKRPAPPDFLEKNWKKWGEEYVAKRRQNPSFKFDWKTWKGKRVNQHLLPLLIEMTDDHCAFCDWFPMDCGTIRTIDHFKPKSEYPYDAYHWINLYLACPQCQTKLTKDLAEADYLFLLRPDGDEYTFERYFIYNYRTGDIEPFPAATPEDRRRAELTIKVFRLNEFGRPAARKRMLSHFNDLDASQKEISHQDQPFRYLISSS